MNRHVRFWIRWSCFIVMGAASASLMIQAVAGTAPSWLTWVGLFGVQASWYFLGIHVYKYDNEKESK